MKQERIAALAERMDSAAHRALAIPQFAEAEGLGQEEAYAVQAASIARRLERGERRTGVKMGFTSRAKMVQMGVHDMIWGRLTDAMAEADGAPAGAGLARWVPHR